MLCIEGVAEWDKKPGAQGRVHCWQTSTGHESCQHTPARCGAGNALRSLHGKSCWKQIS